MFTGIQNFINKGFSDKYYELVSNRVSGQYLAADAF